MQHIEGCTLHKEKEDEWVWRGDATQEYTVKSTYKKMQNGTIGDEETLYGTFWNVKALPTAHIFAWRVLHNRVATYDNLLKRGILLESRRCVVCDTCDESVCHLFLTCRVATQIWKLCDSWIGVSLVHHNRAKDHFLGFDMLGLNSKENCVWRTVWVAILWGIWIHRNNYIFRNSKIDSEEVFTLVQIKSWAWITSKYPKAFFSYSDWYLSPITCLKSMC